MEDHPWKLLSTYTSGHDNIRIVSFHLNPFYWTRINKFATSPKVFRTILSQCEFWLNAYKKTDGRNAVTNCPVCYESYGKTGENIPRLFPCARSICGKCIDQLLDGNLLDCSECGKKHPAQNGVRSFAANIFTCVRRKMLINRDTWTMRKRNDMQEAW